MRSAVLHIAVATALAWVSTSTLAQTVVATYVLDNVWLRPDISHPGQPAQPMTGSFQWTYELGDFENGSGEFTEVDIPWYDMGIENLNITVDLTSIEFSLNGNYHNLGVDVSLFLTEPLSPDQSAHIDTVRSSFDIQRFITYKGHVVSGSVEPLQRTADLVDVNRTLGLEISGGVPELMVSDDTYYVLQSGPGFNPAEPHPARMDCGFDTGGFAAALLDISLEEKSNIGGPTAVVLLRNWTTTQFDELDRFGVGPVDQTFTVAGVPATDYINGANRIEVRVRTFAILILNPAVRGIFSHDFIGVSMRE